MKFRFHLIWLFVLTAIVALATSYYTRRQSALEEELLNLEGTWDSVAVEGFDQSNASFNFKDSRFKLLRPGVFEVKLLNDDIVYGVYVRDRNLLYYNESHPWCGCPTGIDDLQPTVSFDAPSNSDHLYTADRRVTRYLLRLHSEKGANEFFAPELHDNTIAELGLGPGSKRVGNNIGKTEILELDVPSR